MWCRLMTAKPGPGDRHSYKVYTTLASKKKKLKRDRSTVGECVYDATGDNALYKWCPKFCLNQTFRIALAVEPGLTLMAISSSLSSSKRHSLPAANSTNT